MKNKIHLADATLGFDFIGAGAIAHFTQPRAAGGLLAS